MQEASSAVTYELPLNETIRVCLRLEHLFTLINQTLSGDSDWECRYAMSCMLEALNVIDRPDLKSKLVQALSQHAAALTQLEQKPNVDRSKLREILTEMDQLIDGLYKSQDKMVYELRNNAFLSSIRQHMFNPGGAAPFSTPPYFRWLKLPANQRKEQLAKWFAEFDQIKAVVNLLLQLARGSTHPQSLIAMQGFYQQALDPKLPYLLVRVTTPLDKLVYPEISVGKHRLSVRFWELKVQDKSTQTTEDIAFEMTCCIALVNLS